SGRRTAGRSTCRRGPPAAALGPARRGGAVGGQAPARLGGAGSTGGLAPAGHRSRRAGWPERPLLEARAATVVVERDDPKIQVVLRAGVAIADLDPRDAGVALDRDGLARHGELLLWTAAFLFPHPLDRLQ